MQGQKDSKDDQCCCGDVNSRIDGVDARISNLDTMIDTRDTRIERIDISLMSAISMITSVNTSLASRIDSVSYSLGARMTNISNRVQTGGELKLFSCLRRV